MDQNNTSIIMNESSMAWVDWIPTGTMLAMSAGIGIYCRITGDQQKTEEEYFFANRSVKVMTLSYTIAIAFISTITMFAASGENYSSGTIFNALQLGAIFGTPIVLYFYLPVFYELKMLSIYEYLERRFGKNTRLVASTSSFFILNFYMGVAMCAPALVLQDIIGLNDTTIILLIGLVCIFYSTIGGIKAVILTEALQGSFILICALSVIGVALYNIEDGIWSVIDSLKKGGRFSSNFQFDPTIQYTWWSLSIGGTFYFLSSFACGQIGIQRLLTAKSIGDARKALWIHLPINISTLSTFGLAGLVLYTYYIHCDPVTSGKISSYDMIMPYFVRDQMIRIPGVTGLFVVGVFSASLGSVSAMLNSLAAIALADYIKPLYRSFGHELPEDKSLFYAKITSVFLGFVNLSIAFLAAKFNNLIQMIVTINGVIGGPLLGVFTLGMFSESANESGAIAGIIIAILSNLFWVFSPKPLASVLPMATDGCFNATYLNQNSFNGTDDSSSYFYMNRLSYLWISPLGMNTAMTFGTIVSFIVQKCSKTPPPILDVNLFTPILARRIKRRREKEANSSQLFVLETKNFD